MSDPFIGEVRIVGFNFPPRGYATCDGGLLPIDQNQSLFSILGTTYGGDGRTTFALPDLRGRTPIHVGSGHTLGQRAGTERHALTLAEMPSHGHVVQASSDNATTADPTAAVPAAATHDVYATPGALTGMDPAALAAAGAGLSHENMQPFLTLNFVIALVGLFPSRN